MTSSAERHLSEEERQCAADGTLRVDQTDVVLAHLERCPECASDVAHLRTLMTRVHGLPDRDAAAGDLWPEIRSRIEQAKVVALDAPTIAPARTAKRRRFHGWLIAPVAAAIVVAVALPRLREHNAGTQASAGSSRATSGITNVADSSAAVEQEATRLLDELELQRALLRPQEAAALDRDLHTIDGAIAELKTALKKDPNNPALRRLLASSLRQKVELLKRANHAG